MYELEVNKAESNIVRFTQYPITQQIAYLREQKRDTLERVARSNFNPAQAEWNATQKRIAILYAERIRALLVL